MYINMNMDICQGTNLDIVAFISTAEFPVKQTSFKTLVRWNLHFYQYIHFKIILLF